MHPKTIRYSVLLADLMCICASAVLAYALRVGGPFSLSLAAEGLRASEFLIAVATVSWIFAFGRLKLDGFYGGYDFSSVISQLFTGMFVLLAVISSAGFLVRELIPRLTLAGFLGLFFIFAVAVRLLIRMLAVRLAGKGRMRRVLILGQGRIAQELYERIQRHPEMRWEVVGFLFPANGDAGESQFGASDSEQFNTLQIESLIASEEIDEVILASAVLETPEILNLIGNCRGRGIQISFIPRLYHLYVNRPTVTDIDGLPVLSLWERSSTGVDRFTKRCFDVILGGLLLVLAAPLMLFATVILLTKGKQPLVSERRCGLGGELFRMYRFNVGRMEECYGFEWLMRKVSVTELPQLLNVLLGHMSLVGPRPETEERVKRYSDWHRQRLLVKPGMSGLAQVHGIRDEDSSENKSHYDLRYMQNWSLLMDISLLIQTIWTVATRFFQRSTPLRTQTIPTTASDSRAVELAHADRT